MGSNWREGLAGVLGGIVLGGSYCPVEYGCVDIYKGFAYLPNSPTHSN